MMKLRYKLRNFLCAVIVVVLGVFLAVNAFMKNGAVFADEDTAPGGEHFVTIYDDGASLLIKTSATTVADMLERLGITVDAADIVEPSLDTAIVGSDYKVNIYRARPVLVTDGIRQNYIMTATHDPKRLANEAGFTVYDGDDVELVFNQNFLEAGAAVTYKIIHNGGQNITVDEALPYEVITEYDYHAEKGTTVLKQPGEDGRRISVYNVKLENGVEVERTLISEKVTVEATPEIVVVGAKPTVAPGQEECAGWMVEAGIPEQDLEAALYIVEHESHCNVYAQNPRSGAYGIPQALNSAKDNAIDPRPGSKMASAGEDWQTNPVTQLRWMNTYVVSRYGSWSKALEFKLSRGWY